MDGLWVTLSDTDLATSLRWFEKCVGLPDTEALDDGEGPYDPYDPASFMSTPRALGRLYEHLRALWDARGLGAWEVFDPERDFCLVCNQREATTHGQSRASGAWLAVCAECVASNPMLLREGEVYGPTGDVCRSQQ